MIENIEIPGATEFIDGLRPRVGLKSNAIYRGVSDAAAALVPGIFRLSTLAGEFGSWKELERVLLLEFYRQSVPHLTSSPRSMIEWVALAQHHGLPTRLLDWTENPLVALFFAVADQTVTTDSAVWRLETNHVLEDLSIWSHFDQAYHDLSLRSGTQLYYPTYLAPRVVAQRGCFTAHNDFPEGFSRYLPLEEQAEAGAIPNITLTKYTIPAAYRGIISVELDSMGMDPHAVFPDLDGLCRKLRSSLARLQIIRDIQALVIAEKTRKQSHTKKKATKGRK